VVILIREEFAAKALANRFALFRLFRARRRGLDGTLSNEARLYDKDRREHRAAGHYMEG
jgi:hypothetical protein